MLREDLDGARLTLPDDGRGLHLLLPHGRLERGQRGRYATILRGGEAHSALARLMVHVNEKGASESTVADSVELIVEAGSPAELVNRMARQEHVLATRQRFEAMGRLMPATAALALEMALHEETERRALEGELAGLEEMWRQAEEIARLADALPADVPDA